MGKGGHNPRLDEHDDQHLDTAGLPLSPHRLPTLSEIKVKVPAHCFRPTVRQSMSYVVKDILFVILTFAVMYKIEQMVPYGFLLFPLYWFIQGTFYTSIFVLGHDCGHGSFSVYPLLNDIVGTFFYIHLYWHHTILGR